MQTKPIVVHDANGTPEPADLIVCKCGGEAFVIYYVNSATGRHKHLQCTECGLSYCDGSCSPAGENRAL